jgi:hypothetical protein
MSKWLFCVWGDSRFELQVLCLLGMRFPTSPFLFVLVILEIECHFLPRPAWSSYFKLPTIAEIQMCATESSFCLLRWRPGKLCSGWLGTTILPISASHVVWHDSSAPQCLAIGWNWVSELIFPELTSNHNPPDLNLLSS